MIFLKTYFRKLKGRKLLIAVIQISSSELSQCVVLFSTLKTLSWTCKTKFSPILINMSFLLSSISLSPHFFFIVRDSMSLHPNQLFIMIIIDKTDEYLFFPGVCSKFFVCVKSFNPQNSNISCEGLLLWSFT